MSFKAKTLSYEAQEPSFLRNLRAQKSGRENDRHERAIARPRRAKPADDEDDAPTYVDEDSNQTVSKQEYEALIKEQERTTESAEVVQTEEETLGANSAQPQADVARTKQEVTEVGGAMKKRKVAKVVGGEAGDEEDTLKAHEFKKPKKKVKAVKLSFGAEEG